MKEAKFYKKYHYLKFFNSENTMICKNCETAEQARAIIKSSGIHQTLKTI